MHEPLSEKLNKRLATLVPGVPLAWRELPGCGGLRGFFLEEESASRPLSPEKMAAVMQEPPFWALLWPSGERVCRLLAEHGGLVSGLSVLDFAAGSGLVACAAARAGAAAVLAVDLDPLAMSACRLHALENGVAVQVSASAPEEARVDLLLVADFLYDSSHLAMFELLQARAGEVLVVDSRLRELPMEGFTLLGTSTGKAIPDLDPSGEFGLLRFWYRGARRAQWEEGLRLYTPVAQGL